MSWGTPKKWRPKAPGRAHFTRISTDEDPETPNLRPAADLRPAPREGDEDGSRSRAAKREGDSLIR